MNDSDNAGRLKGSIKDRLISFLYRKRYKIKLQKNKLIKKEEKVKINYVKKTKIENIRDLKKMGAKVIKVDVNTEKFDFEKYDYYMIEPVMKKGIDTKKEEYTSKKNTLEKTKNNLKNIKEDLKSIEKNNKENKDINKKLEEKKKELDQKTKSLQLKLNKLNLMHVDNNYIEQVKKNAINEIDASKRIIAYYEEEIEKYKDLEDRKSTVLNKINDLKDQINLLDIDFINIKELEDLKLDEENIEYAKDLINKYEEEIKEYENNLDAINAINTAEFVNPIGVKIEQEPKVEKKENIKENKEIEKLEENKNKDSKLSLYKASEEKIEKKKIEIANKYDGKVISNLKKTDNKMKNYLDDINLIVNKMNEEVDKVTKNVKEVTKSEGYGRVIASALKVATGILTLPLSNVNIFNIALGSALINKGIKGLKRGLDTKKEIIIDYDYEDLTNKIKNTKDKLNFTNNMIKDSLYQIKELKKYNTLTEDNLNMLERLEINLNSKLKEIESINKKLNKQDEKNKVKIKKINNKEY